MKRLVLIFILPLLHYCSYAQNKTDAELLVNEGVVYHDKGDYATAIEKYDKALGLDKNNLLALAEKAFSLIALQKFDEAVEYCEKAIKVHAGGSELKTVYVTYGNALDGLKKTNKAIDKYNDGIKLFPDFYQLHFNKGISLASLGKYDEAILSFQTSVSLKPDHASSHNAIARLSDGSNKRIPALLAYSRFLIIEPDGPRAEQNLSGLQKIVKGNIQKTGEKSVTVSISPDMLDITPSKGKRKENNFASTDLLLSMSAALDLDEKYINQTEIDQFIRKFENVIASLNETKKDNSGFYWNYYVPYFIGLKDMNFLETFAYVVFSSRNTKEIGKWLDEHKDELMQFYTWSKSFEWKAD